MDNKEGDDEENNLHGSSSSSSSKRKREGEAEEMTEQAEEGSGKPAEGGDLVPTTPTPTPTPASSSSATAAPAAPSGGGGGGAAAAAATAADNNNVAATDEAKNHTGSGGSSSSSGKKGSNKKSGAGGDEDSEEETAGVAAASKKDVSKDAAAQPAAEDATTKDESPSAAEPPAEDAASEDGGKADESPSPNSGGSKKKIGGKKKKKASATASSSSLEELASYWPTPGVSLVVARGSVLDFRPKLHPEKGAGASSAIVNAANPGCLGGGGVDGAITAAGGPELARDRRKLPLIRMEGPDGPEYVRCPTGCAVVTGPAGEGGGGDGNGSYGTIATPYVIHAVGPNYWDYCHGGGCRSDSDDENDSSPSDEDDDDEAAGVAMAHGLLASAYTSSLDLALQNDINQVAFSLLSAGVYRGPLPLESILRVAVDAIGDWAAENCDNGGEGAGNNSDAREAAREDGTGAKEKKGGVKLTEADGAHDDNHCATLMEVTLCAFNERECDILRKICDEKFEPIAAAAAARTTATATVFSPSSKNSAAAAKEVEEEEL